MASFFILLTAHTARIACSDRHTYIQTDRQNDYCNPLCACAPRVNEKDSRYYHTAKNAVEKRRICEAAGDNGVNGEREKTEEGMAVRVMGYVP